ncbi:MAG: hypothetical protein AAGN46_01580 [Acidobacteriota bacterium]
MKTIQNRIREAINDSAATEEQGAFFEKALRETAAIAQERANRALFVYLLFVTSWFLIRNAAVSAVQFIGLKFDDTDIIVLALSPMAAFSYYRYTCFAALAELNHVAVRSLYVEVMKPFSSRGLTELLIPPSFIHIENTLANIENTGFFSEATNAWGILVLLIMHLGPAVPLVWMIYSIMSSPVVSIGWSVAAGAIAALVLVRTWMVIIQMMRAV